MTKKPMGLTQAEVQAQFDAGHHNLPLKPLTRTVRQIIQDNTLTLFNVVNFVIGILIITTGRLSNLLFLFIAVINTVIGTFQEIRSKHQIDKLSLVATAKTKVIRDGQEDEIDQSQIVLGDVIVLRRGDQVPVDGKITITDGLSCDESQLTGESIPIEKGDGDQVFSGSFILSGKAFMEVTAVGKDTSVSKIALSVKKEKKNNSQLLKTINRIIQVLTYILIPLGITLFMVSMLKRGDYNRAILSASAAMLGMIPEGLVLLTNVALAVSARNLAQKRVLVRSLPAIESLARVDVLCLDKTGTITSGKLKLADIITADSFTKDQVKQAAAQIVYALNDDNETALALKDAVPDFKSQPVEASFPFDSAYKWSGIVVGGQGLVLGAPEFVFPDGLPDQLAKQAENYTHQGYRVLVIAKSAAGLSHPLPAMTLMGLVLITDELRPRAVDTFAFFKDQDVTLKVISGDNPATVASIAQRAKIKNADSYVDMSKVGENADFVALTRENTVFGRVTPEQKKHLIMALQEQHHTVAMTGDGVNDVPALRQADCSVAMASGSEAASSIAEFVLLDSNFEAMTGVLNEGRRVINNIQRVASMYLVKTIYSVLLSIIYLCLMLDYPIIPINLTPISAVLVAIPSFFLALEPNFQRVSGNFMHSTLSVAAPAAISVVLYNLFLTLLSKLMGLDYNTTATMSSILIAVVSFNVLLSVSKPYNSYKIFMLAACAVATVVVFTVLHRPFSFVNIFDWHLALIYCPLILSTFPVYWLVGKTVQRFLLWNEHRKQNG
ncbi:cation-translocating P-type ATPase [Convivina intestini]|uniref:Cation-transporting ATPase E n=1 Tax=Convivina intestini TaxID=1505726 RepID=A0A2U1DFK3_9LACO|nr:cation-translocating P-type ATPase [Convivina intestini]PVY86359.1 cation-transporting ATPase E [Convivina intestini]CAH1850680.1 Calcium-transporting ATPase CtpE [Convivina intestini]SDB82884.1 cation-transporting ATPase E [Leuconostocaceae bacterium R-53105]